MKNHDPDETTTNDFREALALLEQKLRDCEDSESLIDGLLEGTAQFYGADRAYIIHSRTARFQSQIPCAGRAICRRIHVTLKHYTERSSP